MKKLTLALVLMLLASLAQAGPKTRDGTVFAATFAGTGSYYVAGSGLSNPTQNKGNITNLVFNKLKSQVSLTLAVGSVCDGLYETTDVLVTTMQLYDGFGRDAESVARVYFWYGGIHYKLELSDTDHPLTGWSDGDFPPFGGGSIHRSANYWEINSVSKGDRGKFCDGESGTFDSAVDFVLEADSN
ncbi:MAG: hypothetical protein EX260_10075 [Desulfobulbaceae bacterium]|nr:MAG: hypothetical protein EX260_10075 [Desulfobulbaceae bacterium]